MHYTLSLPSQMCSETAEYKMYQYTHLAVNIWAAPVSLSALRPANAANSIFMKRKHREKNAAVASTFIEKLGKPC